MTALTDDQKLRLDSQWGAGVHLEDDAPEPARIAEMFTQMLRSTARAAKNPRWETAEFSAVHLPGVPGTRVGLWLECDPH